MKILITSLYRPGNETGTARISEELSETLSKKHDVTYLCLGEKYQIKKRNRNLFYFTIPSLPIKQAYVPKLTPDVVRQMFKDLDKISPDVIHAQNIAFTTLICLIWAIRNNSAFVVTFHSLPSEGINYVFPKLSNKKILSQINYSLSKSYNKKLLENVNLIIALNKYVQRSIHAITRKTKTIVINNGLDLKPFRELEIKTSEKDKVFTFVGSFVGRKNQEFLVKAFAHLPKSYHLKLYGNIKSGDDYVKKIKKIIVNKRINNVEIHDFIDRKKLLQVLAKSDYFVSASMKEVQSLVIIESLASATPIIGLKNETINELIDGKNGISFPKNITPRAFAKNIFKYVKTNEKDYYETSRYAREGIQKFDIGYVSEKILNAYEIAKKIKSKKNSKVVEELISILPKSLQELLRGYYDRLKRRKTTRIWVFVGISMLLTILTYPILNFVNYLKNKRVFG
ncbi:hypothetical protein A2715_00885 [Candidatus Woesebacteria bacterium RIFCSPHIGHO2_01_FULL_39_32]|uniref:Glycosyltransferase subfamily 4-like N-terminal domain-containing protein n=2 Tax=Candidatus Woeseibacteriota TaxID=1752722 RepID=A0A1F8BI85_9BACT|nr:MAG: hypothetical protein A2124_03680 [Candidatus Woesebacteria bacterium GWB1_37_5]OGM24468.1 MAG: hypothetical protein A2715_00885 [Candidatus Woesebacteria bacterium RIFCSPHIGHO2_01_FULL_39_32]OGM37004.1 MAG: hypothetical protein A3F01_05190 [Candidatus Woesebacteria bacterium RIFCSPHIGHO2_12_FULL_38_11]OGM63774.1 MAG: hypothetical protein A2893_02220 [Candidatus Woesebacteria bacterium RIFCSPLOWO2_01_FULL_39_25]